MSRILGIVVGALTVIMGIYCLCTPVITFGVVGWLIALAMIADGVSKVMLWNDYKQVGVSDTWALIGGVLSIVFGVVLAGSNVMQAAVDVFVATLVSFWLLFAGIVRIMRSFRMRDIHQTLGTQILGANWGLALIMGIIMVVMGIMCIANPVIVMVAMGWQIGFALVAGGIGLITATA